MFRLPRCLVLITLASVVSIGCVDDQEIFYVDYAVGVDPESCEFDDSVKLLNDVIDTSSGGTVALGLLVRNVSTQNGASNTNVEDDGELAMKYAEVRLAGANGAPLSGESEFEVTIPGDSLSSGEEMVVVVPFPAAVAAGAVGSTVEVSVILVADRTDQAGGGKLGEVRSREFTFPYQVCTGCLPCPMTACGLATGSACPEEEDATTDTTTGP